MALTIYRISSNSTFEKYSSKISEVSFEIFKYLKPLTLFLLKTISMSAEFSIISGPF